MGDKLNKFVFLIKKVKILLHRTLIQNQIGEVMGNLMKIYGNNLKIECRRCSIAPIFQISIRNFIHAHRAYGVLVSTLFLGLVIQPEMSQQCAVTNRLSAKVPIAILHSFSKFALCSQKPALRTFKLAVSGISSTKANVGYL